MSVTNKVKVKTSDSKSKNANTRQKQTNIPLGKARSLPCGDLTSQALLYTFPNRSWATSRFSSHQERYCCPSYRMLFPGPCIWQAGTHPGNVSRACSVEPDAFPSQRAFIERTVPVGRLAWHAAGIKHSHWRSRWSTGHPWRIGPVTETGYELRQRF